MTKSNQEKPNKSNSEQFLEEFLPAFNQVQAISLSQITTINILRIIGYGLLVLSLFDWVEIFTPLHFTDPNWEFQTVGSLVERVPVSLIGLGLVFFGKIYNRRKWELLPLKLLSWLSLLLALLFILVIPLGVIDTIRLERQSIVQINNQSQQKTLQTEKLKEQLNKATPQQIENYLKTQGNSLNGKSPEEVKNQLLLQVNQAQKQIKTQAQQAQSLAGSNLIKSSIKWNLGALVAATIFFIIWRETHWARM